MGANESFLGHNIAGGGGVGNERMKPKPISIEMEKIRMYLLLVWFFSQRPKFFWPPLYLKKTTNNPTLIWGVGKGVQIVYFSEVTSAPFEDIVSTMFHRLIVAVTSGSTQRQ